MPSADAPLFISTPIPVLTDFIVPVQLVGAYQQPVSFVGRTVNAYVLNPGVTPVSAAVSYTVSGTSASVPSLGAFTLSGASHASTGIADIQIHVDGLLRGRYRWEFVAKYS